MNEDWWKEQNIKDMQNTNDRYRYGWSGSIGSFLSTDQCEWLRCISSLRINSFPELPSNSQISAWINSFNIMQSQLGFLVQIIPDAMTWGIVFEYELPRERGRRPDVIILTPTHVLVLEFKDTSELSEAHIDQVKSYVRDLQNYHSGAQSKVHIPLLVLTKSDCNILIKNVQIIAPNHISNKLITICPSGRLPEADLEKWLSGVYAPLPSLVDAARMIFNSEPLPQIKRAESAGIPQTLSVLGSLVKTAQNNSELHLALITGVPGAGKTLVGLQFVYAAQSKDGSNDRSAVFLSGNGPLVKVLQHALKNKIFVQDVHGFLKEYGGSQSILPEEHIWVYDEAQRAWDAERVLKYRGHVNSEPTDFLKIGERLGSWAVMVGLIGEGQEIHLGEEAGLKQWNDAIGMINKPCVVHCASRVAQLFTNAVKIIEDDKLDLTASLRSHMAEDLQVWVSKLIDGQIKGLSELARKIQMQGFEIYITRDLDQAKNYAKLRYEGIINKRYGLIASSKSSCLPKYGINNDYYCTQRLKIGPWFNDEPSSLNSCCQLKDVATEFQCQGLELDLPIVCWESDLLWTGNCWRPKPQPRSKANNPDKLRLNSYRVLLTRGRDGLVIFIPNEKQFNLTYEILVGVGALPLKIPSQPIT